MILVSELGQQTIAACYQGTEEETIFPEYGDVRTGRLGM
jgi:hypothetical protein